MGSTNNKVIAKNTIVLYLRMIISMLISFYTSRLILKSLGVVDFGIYNVVSGFVVIEQQHSALFNLLFRQR